MSGTLARGRRWGCLLASLDAAKLALDAAVGHADLLEAKGREVLMQVADRVRSVEYVAWKEYEAERAPAKPRRKP